MKGADEKELRAQIDLLIFQAYPRAFLLVSSAIYSINVI